MANLPDIDLAKLSKVDLAKGKEIVKDLSDIKEGLEKKDVDIKKVAEVGGKIKDLADTVKK